MATYNVSTAFNGIDRVSNAFINMGRSANTFKKRAGGAIKGVSSAGLGLGAVLGGISIGLVARKIYSFANESIDLFNIQEAAVANVQAGLVSTAGVAGRSLNQLKTQAADLQKKTFFGDETILQNATAQLLTFTNITESNFDRTQAIALDVTSKLKGLGSTGEDLRSTSILLGKALNDPVANLGALSRVGIQFSVQQKEQIKTMAKGGNVIGAQNIVLKELERQYGGTAEALAKTSGGMELSVKNLTGDVKELIGKALSPLKLMFLTIFKDILPSVIPFVTEIGNKLGVFVETNKALIQTKVGEFFKSIFETFKKLVPIAMGFFKIIYNLFPLIKLIAGAFIVWKVAIIGTQLALKGMALIGIIGKVLQFIKIIFMIAKAKGVWAAAQWALNAALNANPIGLVVAAIVVLIAIIVVVVKYWDQIVAAVIMAWEWFDKYRMIILALLGPMGMLVNMIVSLIKGVVKTIIAFKDGGLVEGFKELGRTIFDFMITPLESFLTLLSKIPGIGKVGKIGLEGIDALRAKMSTEVSKEPVPAPNAAKETGKRNLSGEGTLTIKAEPGTSISQMDNSLLGINIAQAGVN